MAPLRNLPPQPNTLIGRHAEVRAIVELLVDPTCRLLTLVGPGGIGKTRLAVAAVESLDDFADGSYFIPLQSVRDVADMVPAIADVLQVTLTGANDPQTQLLKVLSQRETLLLLDNIEHLLDGAELLSDLLQAAPSLKILVTSREVLNLREEWLYPVEGLSVPPQDDVDKGDAYESVQLFVERARRIRPRFDLSDNMADVVRICRLVEGMPLALELSASWIAKLSCAAISAQIERNLAFLSTTLRNVPERHRSMRAAFAHSWRLLNDEEQQVFARLALFQGGFSLAAAEYVAQATLPVLSSLVDKSLLRREPSGRYQIHELLRQYGEEQLAQEQSDLQRIRTRHCDHFVTHVAQRAAAIEGGKQRQALDEIAVELDNIRAAWRWAAGRQQIARLQKVTHTLMLFYQYQSRYREGYDAFTIAATRVAAAPASTARDRLLAELSLCRGWLCIRLGRLDEAKQVLESAIDLYAGLATPPAPGIASDPRAARAILASVRGDYETAARLGEQARQVAAEREDIGNLAFAFYALTSATLAQGQYEEAEQFAQQALAATEAVNNRWFMAYVLNDLGHIARAVGDLKRARQHFQASYAIREEFDDSEGMAAALNNLAGIAVLREEYGRAEAFYLQSADRYREIGDQGGLAEALRGLAVVRQHAYDESAARRYFRQALQIASEANIVPLLLSIVADAAGFLLDRTGQGQEMLSFVACHPASAQETVDRAQQMLRGRGVAPQPVNEQGLDAVIAALLAELIPHTGSTPDTAEDEASPTQKANQALVEPLTPREREVLQLLAKGLSNPEIAERLVVAVGTVKAHTSNIYGKLAVGGRAEAVSRAHELGLV